MRWWIYNALFPIGYLLMMPAFLRRMWKRGGYRANFGQRFARYTPEVRAALARRRRLWIHAVSVGEAFAAGRLIDELRRQSPDLAIVLSTTSSTGYGVCRNLVGPEDVLLYFPTDFPWVVRRALDAIQPLGLVLTESELWPNVLLECARRQIPTVLVNGRVSDRSFPRYKALRFFFGPVLRSFRRLLVQYEQDRARLVAIGADPAAVQAMGTVKFDVVPPAPEKVAAVESGLRAAGIRRTDTVLLGASTWPGEEAVLLEAYRTLREGHPGLRLVLVPRHMERGDEVEAAIVKAGCACLRRSRMVREGSPAEPVDPSAGAVLLADTTGELHAFCAVADLVFVGKTLSPNVGGQNMIEPLSLGKPVVVGPHTENFAGVMDILRKAGAVREVAEGRDLAPVFREWLEAPEGRQAFGRHAAATVATQAGALGRSARAVLEVCLRIPNR